MKKIFLLFLFAIATCGIMANAATKYEINVGGVEVTSDNASHITGGDIESGYGVYNASTNTLTFYGIHIYRTSQDKYGIHNRKCDNLKIVFNGSCMIQVADNALKLERATTLEAADGSNTSFYTSARICANLKSYTYYIKGSGQFYFDAQQSGYEAIKGDGTGSTKVYFQGGKITARSVNRSALSSFSAYFYNGTHLVIKSNGSDASVSNVATQFNGREAVISPYTATYYNNSVCIGSTPITNQDIIISDDYVAILNASYFPDPNFRSALYSLYPKGYINSSDVENCTTLLVAGKNISNLTGLGYFTKLTFLGCANNNLSSLPSLPSSLKNLYCGQNNLTTLPSLPNGLATLSCFNNKLTSLTVTDRSALSYLDCSDNTSLTKLYCYNNAITTLKVTGCSEMTHLDCHSNKLTSLDMNGCSKLNYLYCYNNQLTSLYYLPTVLVILDISTNKLSGSLNLCNYYNLNQLDCHNNPDLTELECSRIALKELDVSNCTALNKIDCSFNQLTSVNLSNLSNLTMLICHYNKLTSLDVSNNTKLKEIYAFNNQLTTINVEGCSALTDLSVAINKLTSLSVQGCNALRSIICYYNQIKESGMNTLVNSLCTIPEGDSGFLGVLNLDIPSEEGNVITDAQVITARNKRWIAEKHVNGEWQEITVSIPVGDVNCDGSVNAADVTALYNFILNGDKTYLSTSDVNNDDAVNAGDVTAVYNIILGQN